MNKKGSKLVKSIFLSLFLFLLFSSGNIRADKKYFGRSYTSYTLPAGALELELWQTGRLDKGIGNYYRWQPRFEVEYGITDRLTGSMYLNFNEVKSANSTIAPEPFSLSNTSFEFRYRLSNQGEYFVDPALYFEFGYSGEEISYEPKILLTKRIDKFISVLNINSEIERSPSKNETESSLEFTAGLAYELSNHVSLGLEFRNHRNYENIFDEEENQASFVGPTISFQGERFYFVVNFLAQVGGSPATVNNLDLGGHEKYEIRTILGIEL